MSDRSHDFDIQVDGTTSFVRFAECRILDHELFVACKEELAALAEDCEVLAVDVDGIDLMCSDWLAFFAHFRNRGLHVQLCNPSDHIRQLLSVTKLDALIELVDLVAE